MYNGDELITEHSLVWKYLKSTSQKHSWLCKSSVFLVDFFKEFLKKRALLVVCWSLAVFFTVNNITSVFIALDIYLSEWDKGNEFLVMQGMLDGLTAFNYILVSKCDDNSKLTQFLLGQIRRTYVYASWDIIDNPKRFKYFLLVEKRRKKTSTLTTCRCFRKIILTMVPFNL